MKTKSGKSMGCRYAAHMLIRLGAVFVLCVAAFCGTHTAGAAVSDKQIRLLLEPKAKSDACFQDYSFEFSYNCGRLTVYSSGVLQGAIDVGHEDGAYIEECIAHLLSNGKTFRTSDASDMWLLSLFVGKRAVLSTSLDEALANAHCRSLFSLFCSLSPFLPDLHSCNQHYSALNRFNASLPVQSSFRKWHEIKLTLEDGGNYESLFIDEEYWREIGNGSNGYRTYHVTPDSMTVTDLRKMTRTKRSLCNFEKIIMNRLVSSIDSSVVYCNPGVAYGLDCAVLEIDNKALIMMCPVDLRYVPNASYSELYDYIKRLGDKLNPIHEAMPSDSLDILHQPYQSPSEPKTDITRPVIRNMIKTRPDKPVGN